MLSDNWANIMFTTKKICGQVAIIRRLLLWGRNYVLRLRISRKIGSDLDWVDKINIDLRDGNAVLDSRAGTAPNRKDTGIKSGWICLRPFEMLVIDPRGTVGLCSEDVLFKEPMGNLRDFSIKEIWGGEEYFLVRQKFLNGDRACKTTCAQCDYHGASEDFVAELLPGA